ncbi:MAG: NAD-dependent epimerase/dehydratase family protein, partial [Actinobacteria bacterium]
MRILVTGGAGFIGSNLVHALVGRHDVGVIDDLSTGSPANLHPAAWHRTLDVLDGSFALAVAEFGPDAIVHLAAQVSVAVSVREPERDRLVNVEGTRAAARAAAACGCARMLSASSAAVYGEPQTLPMPETHPKSPQSPYGASKLEAESVLAAELAGTGVDFASLRFANVYGPRQDANGEAGVVAIFCDAIRADGEPVVFGDGHQTRDFIYVGDVVDAVITALEHEGPLADDGIDGPAYNIGTGERTSVDALVAGLRLAARWTGAVAHGPERAGDVEHSALDPAKAAAVLGWRARVPLET